MEIERSWNKLSLDRMDIFAKVKIKREKRLPNVHCITEKLNIMQSRKQPKHLR